MQNIDHLEYCVWSEKEKKIRYYNLTVVVAMF